MADGGFPPIAIVGRACLLPGAASPGALWQAVAAGRDLVTRVPPGRWRLDPDLALSDDPTHSVDRAWSDRGGYVHGFESLFDPSGFAVPAEEILPLDPLFQWTLHVGREALRDAGHDASHGSDRVGVVMGNLSFPSEGLARFAESVWLGDAERPDPRNRFMSGLPAHVLARALRLGGGGFALDAACASSLYAIKLACDRLHDGDADLMLAGAVNRADDLFIHVGFCALQALSRTGRSRPFHREADGLLPAEGAAFVVLKRLRDAETAGDRILGVIRGVGLSNDGRGSGFLAPAEEGQLRAMRAAYAMASVRPADVSLLECHATGTPVGDAVELRSAAAVFGDLADLPIGSLKSNTGHLVTAAGAASLLKVLGAFEHGVRPPTLHVDDPLPAALAAPFRPLREAEPWDSSEPRRAAISAFGFGGNNAHLIVEERSRRPTASTTPPPAPPEAEVAVVALGAAVGEGRDRDDLLRLLFPLDGDGSEVPAPIARAVRLSAEGLRFPPRDLEQALPQQLLILSAARESVAAAGALPRESTGVLVGMQCDPEVARYGTRWRLAQRARDARRDATWTDRARDAVCPPLESAGVVGTMPNIVANRLNRQLDLAGPSFSVSAEELSGVAAWHVAVRALRARELDAAVVGAVDVCAEPVHTAAIEAVVAPEKRTPGDAAVALVLMRAEDARREGRPILALASDLSATSTLTVDASALAGRAGHPHAASGLLAIAAATLACAHAARPARGPQERALPWLAAPGARSARIDVEALGGARGSVALAAPVATRTVPLRPRRGRRVAVFSGADRDAVRDALGRRRESPEGPSRIGVVLEEGDEAAGLERARAVLDGRAAPGGGAYLHERPIGGELAFVFTGPAGAYRGMGRDLLLARPDLLERLGERFAALPKVAGWAWDGSEAEVAPAGKLWGASVLCQAHAAVSLEWLGRPGAAIGFCSGETNALFALGAWSDLDGLARRIDEAGVYERELAGEFALLQRAWGEPAPRWANWRVLAPLDQVRAAIADEPRVHLTTIHAPGDAAIGGDAEACERVVARLGRERARPQGYDLAIHTPEMAGFAEQWRQIHDWPTAEVRDVRFYTHATLAAYRPTRESAADALVGQALHSVDFPAMIERAWNDGVRVFVEHGPQAGCTRWIERILGDREHVAVALDVAGDSSLRVLAEAAARLAAAGVGVDLDAVNALLRGAGASRAPDPNSILTFPAHRPAPVLPEVAPQRMAPAPPLPPVLEPESSPTTAVVAALAPAAVEAPAPGVAAAAAPELAALLAAHQRVATTHREFLERHAAAHQRFLALRATGGAPAATLEIEAPTRPGTPTPAVPKEVAPATPLPATSIPAVMTRSEPPGGTPTGPSFSREQLETLASGRISSVFGELFERQDGYGRQVRMPEPPLLLADRVLGIEAEPGSLGKGTIWTETDVREDGWYLHEGRMPSGVMIESGQADLLLISWLGIDFHNRGERVYRLLGCDLTYHGGLPRPGETLRYDIHVDGHARQDAVRLFFFHYDCRVADEVRLSVRSGQAGFFSDEELAGTAGVLWSPETGERTPEPRLDPPRVEAVPGALDPGQWRAFAAGRLREACGPAFALADTHVMPPRLAGGRMLLLHELPRIEPRGGPWGRGYLRGTWRFTPDDWFFDGHFKNDPCMPGTLMFEGCLQAMAAYMMALGLTLERDGWRFEPVPDTPYPLRCRGQATPESKELVYEVFVDELVDGPEPTLWADILCTVDGTKAFHCRRMGLRLVPDWPLSRRSELLPRKLASPGSDGEWDEAAVLACAWGRPSHAFGASYAEFDGPRRLPRLPGPPYFFMSRVRWLEGDVAQVRPGATIESTWHFRAAHRYFAAQGHETMPFCVLLEALLQPCGWLALMTGIPRQTQESLYFRNLDGTGTVQRHIPRADGTLVSRVTLKNVSASGGMWLVAFDVDATLDGEPVMSLTTGFGFFPRVALEQQVGIPLPVGRTLLDVSNAPTVDLQSRPPGFGARPPLLMIDRFHDLREGRPAGWVVAEKDVDPADWFFKAHFFQDPVQPGSLGIEMLLQALQLAVAATSGAAAAAPTPTAQPLALGEPLTWKYRGQVIPRNRRVRVEVEVQAVERDGDGWLGRAEGSLFVDGLRIYHAENLTARIA